jgi:hypothetical protein
MVVGCDRLCDGTDIAIMLHCVKRFCCTAAKPLGRLKPAGPGIETKLFSPHGCHASLTENKALAE